VYLRRVLWSYVDIRDAANACILALERDGLGCEALNICSDETFSNIPSKELIQRYFPDVTDIRASFNRCEGLYSNAKAKALLGWKINYHWKDQQDLLSTYSNVQEIDGGSRS
jgi:nucleoside-diphosphate-sugar epimerase